MEWVCVGLFFVCAALLVVALLLHNRMEQHKGYSKRLEREKHGFLNRNND